MKSFVNNRMRPYGKSRLRSHSENDLKEEGKVTVLMMVVQLEAEVWISLNDPSLLDLNFLSPPREGAYIAR